MLVFHQNTTRAVLNPARLYTVPQRTPGRALLPHVGPFQNGKVGP